MRKVFLLIAILFTASMAQVVYEPLTNNVYDFLSRISQRGVIKFNDDILPLSRDYLAKTLLNAKQKRDALTSLEKDELKFYEKEFGLEIKMIQGESFSERSSFLEEDPYGRKRIFTYESELFKTNFDLLLATEHGVKDGERFESYSNGFSLYGYLTKSIGFSLRWNDNFIKGENIDPYRSFTPDQGFVPHERSADRVAFDRVMTHVGFGWDWGSASIGKDNVEWGYGESGKLVLSGRPPAYPHIRLDLQPADWIRFNYIHAWLLSNVADTAASYPTYREGSDRIIMVDKFLASHSFILTPFEGFDFTVGESIVYSDNIRVAYLMPLIFFRLADHYMSYDNNSIGDNAQWFFSASSKNHLPNTHLYGTLFIDEFTLSNVFDSEGQRNQFGFTLGGSVTDLPFPNLTIRTEFTKIYPFVYRHYIPSTTYESNYYSLGHWMGHNSDQFYASMTYRFIRGLKAKVWGQYIRRGSRGEPNQQYKQPQPPFLFGLQSNYRYLGLDIQYEIFHNLFVRGKFLDLNISLEQSDGSFNESSYQSFSLSASFGL